MKESKNVQRGKVKSLAECLVFSAMQSKDHVSFVEIDELEFSHFNLMRQINLVSKAGCTVRTRNGKFVVIDLSWIK